MTSFCQRSLSRLFLTSSPLPSLSPPSTPSPKVRAIFRCQYPLLHWNLRHVRQDSPNDPRCADCPLSLHLQYPSWIYFRLFFLVILRASGLVSHVHTLVKHKHHKRLSEETLTRHGLRQFCHQVSRFGIREPLSSNSTPLSPPVYQLQDCFIILSPAVK